MWLEKYLKGDKYIWGILLGLTITSLVVVYSASSSLVYHFSNKTTTFFFLKHAFLSFVALVFAWIIHLLPYKLFFKFAQYGLLLCLPLLLITWFFGTSYNEATRWLNIPILNYTFQSSDIAKLMLVIGLSGMLARRQKKTLSFTPILFWSSSICGLITLSDWSSGLLLFLISLFLIYIGRTPLTKILLLLTIAVGVGYFSFQIGERSGTVSNRWKQYWQEKEVPYQTQQSYVAIISGGILGKGVGKSTQKNFLPNSYSDFTFSIIVEEYGLLGSLVIMTIYLFFFFRIIYISAYLKGAFAQLLIIGLGLLITLQALLHMCVTVGLVPITGLTLPFLSMGGSSLLSMGITTGIILSVSSSGRAKVKK